MHSFLDEKVNLFHLGMNDYQNQINSINPNFNFTNNGSLIKGKIGLKKDRKLAEPIGITRYSQTANRATNPSNPLEPTARFAPGLPHSAAP
jgi:hypothetical protein